MGFQVLDSTGKIKTSIIAVDAATITSGTLPLARLVDVSNAQIAAAAAIDWTKISKAGSSLADLITRSASDLSSGTVAKARMHADYPDRTVAEAIAGVWDFSNGLKERSRATKMGEWQNQAFDAAHFTGSGAMTWTVDSTAVGLNKYSLSGMTMFWSFYVYWFAGTSTIGGTPNTTIQIQVPGGFNHGGFTQSQIVSLVIDAGAAQAGRAELSGSNILGIGKLDGTAWTAGTIGVIGTVFFAIS